MGKGENADYQQFLLFLQCFQRFLDMVCENTGFFYKEIMLEIKKNVCFITQVGDEDTQEELLMMCDEPSSQHFYKVPHYNQLPALKEKILESLCDGKFGII